MFKLVKLLIGLILVLVVFAGFDQFLVRVPLSAPGITQLQTFYVDFRSRLLGLTGVESPTLPDSIEQVIEAADATDPQRKKAQRYLYSDDAGVLQFVDSLEQVPAKFRDVAQLLAE